METNGKKLTDADILDKVIFALQTNRKQISIDLEYKSHQSIYLVTNGTNRLTQDMINRIMIKFPEVNPSFLHSGEGNPLRFKTESKEEKYNFEKPKDSLEILFEIPSRLDRLEEVQRKQTEIINQILEIVKKI
jgi:hypothetical protein